MRNNNFRSLTKIICIGIYGTILSNVANASALFNCSGENDNASCIIQRGSNSDGLAPNVVTQDIIDKILKKAKKAEKLTIEFSPADYIIYPLQFRNINNLTFKLDDNVTMTSIPFKANNKQDSKHDNPWKGVEHIISFINCNNLTLIGSKPSQNQLNDNRPKADITMPSVIDGNGEDWWVANKLNKKLERPTLMYFHNIDGLSISDIEFRNSPRAHLMIRSAKNINIDQILIHSDKDSPNTDGINMGTIQNVKVANSTIYNGDDSIALNSGGDPDQNIDINNMDMYYGHGISVGSHVKADVKDVNVENINFYHTMHGLRFKTQCYGDCVKDKTDNLYHDDNSNPVQISNIHYQHIKMEDVKNPIIYDFAYNDKWSRVRINNISYEDVLSVGISSPASLICKSVNDCKNISFNNVKLEKGALCQDIVISIDGNQQKYKDSKASCLISN